MIPSAPVHSTVHLSLFLYWCSFLAQATVHGPGSRVHCSGAMDFDTLPGGLLEWLDDWGPRMKQKVTAALGQYGPCHCLSFNFACGHRLQWDWGSNSCTTWVGHFPWALLVSWGSQRTTGSPSGKHPSNGPRFWGRLGRQSADAWVCPFVRQWVQLQTI